MSEKYNVDEYWTDVAKSINDRNNGNIVAGDDEPYYRKKRNQFVKMLLSIDFNNKSVLEVGCGPGGNLLLLEDKNPSRLVGVDISEKMIEIARNNVSNKIELYKANGTSLPFDDMDFDIVFTSTVLQHNTDKKMLDSVIKELCRVSKNIIYIFERIESRVKGDLLNEGRPIHYYEQLFLKNNFGLVSSQILQNQVSYITCGVIRKLFNSSSRKEGEPVSRISVKMQKATLPLTLKLDKFYKANRGMGMLKFEKIAL